MSPEPAERPAPARLLALAVVAAVGCLATGAVSATEVRIHRSETFEDRVDGVFEDLAIDDLGRIFPARELDEVASLEEPFVFSGAAGPDGSWIVGTGSSGRVLAVAPDGSVAILAELEEPQVFAVAAGRRGVFAAGSPSGPVVRLEDGQVEEVFDPGSTYVWGLELDGRGDLLVATGLPGAVWRVGRDGAATKLWESPDAHVRCLAAAPDGSVIAGTAGEGRIVRIRPDGRVETLLDAELPEVVGVAAGADGRVVAALLASEASQVDLSGGADAAAEGGVTVVVQGGDATIGSRAAGFDGPRSLVLELRPGRAPEELVRFADETIHSLALHRDEVWIGTGEEGRLWRRDASRLVLERDLEAGQVVDLAPSGDLLGILTTDVGGLWTLGPGSEAEGRYTSAVVDAGVSSLFGSWSVRGAGLTSAVEVRVRSGLASSPDGTWTAWTPSSSTLEADLGELGPGRYAQWQVRLHPSEGARPVLGPVELTTLPLNGAPRVTSLAVLAPGEILVPSSFTPQNQTFEPWSPNREGIFETLRTDGGNGSNGTKTLWKKGWRTVQWEVEDPDEDALRYRLSFRAEPDDAAPGPWRTMVEELDQSWYSFDSTVLPQGAYRFRLDASDEAVNLPGAGRIATELTTLAVVDNVPPTVVGVGREGTAWSVEVADELEPLRRAEVSIDAAPWRRVPAADGVVDDRRETLRIEVPEGAGMVLLRLVDAAHNVVTVDLGTR